jgi:hypothetical protein
VVGRLALLTLSTDGAVVLSGEVPDGETAATVAGWSTPRVSPRKTC